MPTTPTILVAGRACATEAISGGGGSGAVFPASIVTPLDGIIARFNPGQARPPRPGTCSRFLPGALLYDRELLNSTATGPEDCCRLCSQSPFCNSWTFQKSTQFCFFLANFQQYTQASADFTSGSVDPAPPPAGSDYNPVITYTNGDDVAAASSAARSASLVITCVATFSHEGNDRANLSFPDEQNKLVEALAAANSKVVVVASAPGAVLLPWDSAVNAILLLMMPGQQFGEALGQLLGGDVSPSGKLPITLPNCENEVNFSTAQYPGLPPDKPLVANYSENLNVGYRWYQANGVTPKYPFG